MSRPGSEARAVGVRIRRPGQLVVACILALVLLSPGSAEAHALLLRSNPAADVILLRSPAQVHLWFSEDLNGSASQIIVWDRYRHVMNVGHAALVPGQPRQMVVDLKPLPAGSYLVLWTSVSAEDGHLLRGSYLFSVKKRGPGPSLAGVSLGGPQQTFPDTVTVTSLLAHWIELLATVVWVGVATFSLLIFRPASRALDTASRETQGRLVRRWLLVSLVLLLLASSILLLMEAYSLAGNDWGHVFSRSALSGLFAGQYAQLWVVRQDLVLLAAVFTLIFPALLRRTTRAYNPAAPALVLGVVYLYFFAASGHAASAAIGDVAGSHLVSVSILVDWLHFIADALWFGGQFYIVLVLIPVIRAARDPAGTTGPFLSMLNWFSPAAYASIALFILSGLFSAKVHVPGWYAFFNSIYGRTLIVKIMLIGLMMLTSALTVYILRPQLRQTLARAASDPVAAARPLLQQLTRWLHVNPVLGAGVLLATSVMFYYPVPAGFSPPSPSVYTTHAAGLNAGLTLKPGRSGPNQITIVLRDQQGRPVQQARLIVLTTMLDMVMGTGLGELHQTTPGTFTGTTDLGMGGHWRLQILVYQPSGLTRMSVEVRVGT